MLVTIYCVLFCLIWVWGYAYIMWSLKQIPELTQPDVVEPTEWPRLSVIVPARNEAAHLESAVSTLLGQDYPDLEVILVNDRSTDGTGELVDRLAAQDARIRAVHIDVLPENWLGKVNALRRGTEHATGDWLLFSDADIYFSPGVLRRALALALYKHADHLTLVPDAKPKAFWLEVAIHTFGLLLLITTRAASVNRSDGNAYIGIGAFNLVNAAVFRRTPGFEWLRLEPADDMGIGLMMKRAGGKSFVALAYDELSLHWYTSISAMFKGLEKNLFGPGPRYRWWRLLSSVIQIGALLAAPLTALIAGFGQGSIFLMVIGLVVVGLHIVFSVFYGRDRQGEIVYLLFFPVGLLMISVMMLRAGYKCLKNGGIDWRGTHYSLEQLRAGQRVKL